MGGRDASSYLQFGKYSREMKAGNILHGAQRKEGEALQG